MNVTKQKILEVGSQLVRQKGFNKTGLQEILKASGVPKGSFYFYFKSKKHFGLELIDVYSGFFLQEMDRIILDQTKSGLIRLKEFLDFTKTMFAAENFVGGCPLGNLALEMGDLHADFAEKIGQSFQQMESRFLKCLQDAQQSGEINKTVDIKEAAYFILNSWEGAVVRMKVERSLKPLEILDNFIFNNILS